MFKPLQLPTAEPRLDRAVIHRGEPVLQGQTLGGRSNESNART